MAKTINTRIALKIDTLSNWNSSTFIPLAGEVCIAKVDTIEGSTLQPVMIKVGDGEKTFANLDWISAKAADVYGWAKAATKPTYTANEIEGLDDFINTEIQDSNTTYQFTIPAEGDDKGKLLIESKNIGDESYSKVTALDFVTPDELTTILADYYTKSDLDGKIHTQTEIETIAANKINALINAADDKDGETIANIANLVDYVEKNAGEIAGLVTDVNTANTNASNAVTTAGEAKETANSALEKANEALEGAEGAKASAAAAKASEDNAKASENAAIAAQGKAEEAQGKAEDAQEAAEAAQAAAVAAQGKAEEAEGLASGYAQNALESKNAAAQSAADASEKAGIATAKAGEAEAAKNDAVQAKADAEAAKAAAAISETNAGNSATAAATSETNAGKSEAAAAVSEGNAAKSAEDALKAQVAAEAAQAAAEASNTSATAIANEAKNTADAAKEASDAATEAVAGLQPVATSGSIYDLNEVSETEVTLPTGNSGTGYIIFNCGTATTLI